MFFGIFQGVCIFLLALMLVRPNPPVSAGAAKRVVATKVDYTTGQMVRSPLFWVMYLMFVFVAAGGVIGRPRSSGRSRRSTASRRCQSTCSA